MIVSQEYNLKPHRLDEETLYNVYYTTHILFRSTTVRCILYRKIWTLRKQIYLDSEINKNTINMKTILTP